VLYAVGVFGVMSAGERVLEGRHNMAAVLCPVWSIPGSGRALRYPTCLVYFGRLVCLLIQPARWVDSFQMACGPT